MDELCDDMNVDKGAVGEKTEGGRIWYSKENNKFLLEMGISPFRKNVLERADLH